MSQEIERKFIIEKLPSELQVIKPKPLEQGYIALEIQGQEVRLRKSKGQYWLTVKTNGDMIRKEYEVELSKNQFSVLWPSTLGRRIIKDRYLLPRQDYNIEVDVYLQPLQGLILAEVEFSSIHQANLYEKEAWMGKEVTRLNFLKNRNLLHFDSLQSLLDQVYEGE